MAFDRQITRTYNFFAVKVYLSFNDKKFTSIKKPAKPFFWKRSVFKIFYEILILK